MSQKQREGMTRRAFLRGTAAAGAAAAAVVSVGGEATAAPATEKVVEKGKGYRTTEHIKAYYRSARA